MEEALIWVLKQWETLREKNILRTHTATKGVNLKELVLKYVISSLIFLIESYRNPQERQDKEHRQNSRLL